MEQPHPDNFLLLIAEGHFVCVACVYAWVCTICRCVCCMFVCMRTAKSNRMKKSQEEALLCNTSDNIQEENGPRPTPMGLQTKR